LKGWDDRSDGKLRLRTEIRNHRSGDLRCPSRVEHVIRIDNVTVLDLQVEFVSAPSGSMLRYLGGTPWKDSFPLPGSSVSRRDRYDEREQNLDVDQFTVEASNAVRRNLEIKSTAQAASSNGGGPVQPSVGAALLLTLRP
jgi:hypothetical protein